MSEGKGIPLFFHPMPGLPALKCERVSAFRLNSSPSMKISTVCSAFP